MSRLRGYVQLLRLPALPTALADIGLGALVTRSLPDAWQSVCLLALTSGCLYLSGMIWNDFFDVEQDKRERPDRPIPSGRVSRRSAGVFAALLMASGLFFAVLGDLARSQTTEQEPIWLSTGFTVSLAASVLLYDGWLKRTFFGPVAMGACRFVNVLLGLSVSGTVVAPLGPHLALVVGLYIVGVTWFARTEARTSNRPALRGAAAVVLAALVLALPVAEQTARGEGTPLFPYLLVILGFWIGLPIARAVAKPSPPNVQAAVRRCLQGLIMLDAALAAAIAGNLGLVLLVLLVPALWLNRKAWLYAT